MSPHIARYVRLFALVASGFLTLYASTYGVIVPLVKSGLWDALVWPHQVSQQVMSIPPWRFILGYLLIFAYALSWMSLLKRRAFTLPLFFVATLLQLTIWILMTTTPYASSSAGHIIVILEGFVATSLGLLYLGGHLEGKFFGPFR
jgi:hypothetical protein